MAPFQRLTTVSALALATVLSTPTWAQVQVQSLAAPDLLTGKIYGDPHKLPCTVSGHVGGSSTDLEYVTTKKVAGFFAYPNNLYAYEKWQLK